MAFSYDWLVCETHEVLARVFTNTQMRLVPTSFMRESTISSVTGPLVPSAKTEILPQRFCCR